MSDFQTKITADGSMEQAEIATLCEMIRAITATYVTDHPEGPQQAMAYLMAALPIYTGTLFANLMFMGDVRQQDTARMAKMVQTNFRSGIKVGLNRATRVAQEQGVMGAMQ